MGWCAMCIIRKTGAAAAKKGSGRQMRGGQVNLAQINHETTSHPILPIMAIYICTLPSVDRSVLEMICNPWEKEIYFDEQSKEGPLGWRSGKLRFTSRRFELQPTDGASTHRCSVSAGFERNSLYWRAAIRSPLSFFIHLQHQSYLH